MTKNTSFLIKLINRFKYYLVYFWQLYFSRNEHTILVRQWYRDQGDQLLRFNYPLTNKSIVLDLGGYKGEWAAEIFQRYKCQLHIFEPVESFYSAIKSRFDGVENIHVYKFGLADCNRKEIIGLCADGSSIFKSMGEQSLPIELVDVVQFISDQSIEQIDLIKINIEGAEYDLLDRMISAGITDICTDIQVQFHDFSPDSTSRRNTIREQLNKTHFLTYDYPFVWENWRRKAGKVARVRSGNEP